MRARCSGVSGVPIASSASITRRICAASGCKSGTGASAADKNTPAQSPAKDRTVQNLFMRFTAVCRDSPRLTSQEIQVTSEAEAPR